MSEVDLMFDEGFLEDENGDEVDALVLPIDAIDLAPELRGIILDCDLRGYEHGFIWLLAPMFRKSYAESDPANQCTISGALQSIISFVKTMLHISRKWLLF